MSVSQATPVRAIAFYLPQFHPIPENDQWWGKGFTEWTNVIRATPQFKGHYQPHLPADLGFYDLRVPEVREAQAEMARDCGIHGFCYYHYWFNGRRLIERPFNEVLASGKPDFPFCLCWANEAWTRAWDGHTSQVLMPQEYSPQDDLAHIRWLCGAFADRRYIRVEGKPLFLVYHAADLPDPLGTTTRWREEARRLGVGELHLCRVESHGKSCELDPNRAGFDAGVEFAPNGIIMGRTMGVAGRWEWRRKLGLEPEHYRRHKIRHYPTMLQNAVKRRLPDHPLYRCVTPSWDNAARRAKGANIFVESHPSLYEHWLRQTVDQTAQRQPPERRLLFINAWNEWAEGNHLEPDQKWGHAYLDATRSVLIGPTG